MGENVPVVLNLRGYGRSSAELVARHRPMGGRAPRAIGWLLLFWGLAPLLFFVPPHMPWVLGAVGFGIYFAQKSWRGEYRVHSFGARCPSCEQEMVVASGSLLRIPATLTCYQCHQQPTLEHALAPIGSRA